MAGNLAGAESVIDDFTSGSITIFSYAMPERDIQVGEMAGGERDTSITAGQLYLNDDRAPGAALVTTAESDEGGLTLRWGVSGELNLDLSQDTAIRLTFGPRTRGQLQFNLFASTTGTGFSAYYNGFYDTFDAGAGGRRFTLDLRFADFAHNFGASPDYRVNFADVDNLTLDLLGGQYELEKVESVALADGSGGAGSIGAWVLLPLGLGAWRRLMRVRRR